MIDMQYEKDIDGRIIRVTRGIDVAEITWQGANLDIDFCNYVIMIACSARGVGDGEN